MVCEYQNQLKIARTCANEGDFKPLLVLYESWLLSANTSQLLELGVLLLDFGFLSQAKVCFEQVSRIDPNNHAAILNLANLAHQSGEHALATAQYKQLLAQFPNEPILRRNALTSQEYDPGASNHQRLADATAWGLWAISRSGGKKARPPVLRSGSRPLRVGYVSADICQHTVGLFIKDVLLAHDLSRVSAYVYSASVRQDWVANQIRTAVAFRDVAQLDDLALSKLIQEDQIDVLIDLSGHTSGSRLTAFAYRPAPVMVSWLGYFATTGLPYIDAVLLDKWHAPQGAESQFLEGIVRLPKGRFCYRPVPWANASVSVLPATNNGYITFGCFNNTAKLNDAVFMVWAQILNKLQNSRLILKWRSFNDPAYKKQIWDKFVHLGVDKERVELRGPSFHRDLLIEYADIDIALDPFPFSGGLTTCEALWMGVPVVTFPQDRLVSRQSHALLSVIGMAELSAKDSTDYVKIACKLANDLKELQLIREGLRGKMQASLLMDVKGFTASLEDKLIELFENMALRTDMPEKKRVLHVGAGHKNNGAALPPVFQDPGWQEIRFDIDPQNAPDILGSILNMAEVDSESMDAIYSSHNIEHVHEHEVSTALNEFLRVLKPGGYVLITCPDLQSICAMVANDRLTDAVYDSPAGPIRPIDIIYGHSASLARGHNYMAHKTGFTLKSISAALKHAGFARTAGKRRPKELDLWVLAFKGEMTDSALRLLAEKCMPS